MSDTNVICCLLVKNEAWILKNFIESARIWADLIIVGNHRSMDDSVNIAQQYDFVKVIDLDDPLFNAGARRKILIDEARKIPGRRLIFSIDADEMISANWANDAEWNRMLTAEPGTMFRFDWIEIFPGLENAAVYSQMAAFVDDEKEYIGARIHEPRIPLTNGNEVQLKEIKLLHFILIEPQRMFSKHRWFKCRDFIKIGKRPWPICVMYQDTKIKSYDAPVVPVKKEWIEGYSWLDEYRLVNEQTEKCYWYDGEVLDYFDGYGVKKFRKLNIWDVDWNKKARLLGRKGDYSDPRSRYEVWVHKVIENHREDLKINRTLPYKATRLFGKTVMRALGW